MGSRLPKIENIRIVPNKWWNGFGVRIGPALRIYNVSGLAAVELRLKNGDIYRIGTDDINGLSVVLKSYLAN
jgi:hypothetical protein